MLYKVSDIIKDVRIALDENEQLTALILADSDSLSLENIISQKILHAIRTVSLTSPVSMLSDAPAFSSGTITWKEPGCGSIPLPDNFLRLVAFKMNDWSKVVTEVIYETDAAYSEQKSKYSGVRGNTIKPVCAIIQTDTEQSLEFYSCDSNNAAVAIYKYIPLPSVINDKVEICQRIYNAVIYYTAALTASTYGNSTAETLFKLSSDQLSV